MSYCEVTISLDYRWSLFWIAMPGALLAAVLLLTLCLTACLRRCCCRRRSVSKSCLHGFMALLTIGLATTAGYFLFKGYTEASSALSLTRDNDNTYSGLVSSLQSPSTFLPDPNTYTNLVRQLQGQYTLQRRLSEAYNLLYGQSYTFLSLDFPSMGYDSIAQPAGPALHSVIVVTSFLISVSVVVFFTLLCGTPATRPCLTSFVLVITLFASLTALLLSSTTFAALVPAADMCPQPAIYASLFGSTNLNYYLTCDPMVLPSPYRTTFETSFQTLFNATTILGDLMAAMANQGYSLQYITPIMDHTLGARDFVSSTEQSVGECDAVYARLDRILHLTCEDVSQSAFVAVWVTAALAIALFIDAILFLFWKHRETSLDGSDDERRPLLPTVQGSVQDPPAAHCNICFVRPLAIVFTPCGHVLCRQCSDLVTECPFCRNAIESRMPVYI